MALYDEDVKVSWKGKPHISLGEYEQKMVDRDMTLTGAEMPDPTPMEPPIGYNPQPSMFERMRDMVKAAFAEREMAREAGGDAVDDEEDFAVDEDEMPFSPHEYTEADQRFIEETVVKHNAEVAKRLTAASVVQNAPAVSPALPQPVAPASPALPENQ